MGKLGFWIPRTLSEAISNRREDDPEPFHIGEPAEGTDQEIEQGLRQRPGTGSNSGMNALPRQVYRIGRSVIRSGASSTTQTRVNSQTNTPTTDQQKPTQLDADTAHSSRDRIEATPADGSAQLYQNTQRSIRFPDEELAIRSD